jgi:hypothetical protein
MQSDPVLLKGFARLARVISEDAIGGNDGNNSQQVDELAAMFPNSHRQDAQVQRAASRARTNPHAARPLTLTATGGSGRRASQKGNKHEPDRAYRGLSPALEVGLQTAFLSSPPS